MSAWKKPASYVSAMRARRSRHGFSRRAHQSPSAACKLVARIFQRIRLSGLAHRSHRRAAKRFPDAVAPLIERMRAVTNLPLAVGFGISTPGAGRAKWRDMADGVVVGSAIVR